MTARRGRLALRLLGWFWVRVPGTALIGAIGLHTFGPPAPPPAPPRPAAAAPSSALTQPMPQPVPPADAGIRPGSGTPGPIAAPDPALLQASPDDPSAMLPVISKDGRAPMQVYARGFDASNRRPRVGLVFAGLGTVGPGAADSDQVIRDLPADVTLAFSPYAANTQPLLEAARLRGHEFLLSLPLEPQSYPQYEAGDHALLTSATTSVNMHRLFWALGRIQGYAGSTGALGNLRGERFADSPGAFDPVLSELAVRGLFYVDPRPGAAPLPHVWSRAVDVVVDEHPVRVEIDERLALLEKIAQAKGSALGLAGSMQPLVLQRVQAWANQLPDHGLALAPASALMRTPGGADAAPASDHAAPDHAAPDHATASRTAP
jgi:uncharacterized protein